MLLSTFAIYIFLPVDDRPEVPVFRPEIVAPFRNAMRFVNSDKGQGDIAQEIDIVQIQHRGVEGQAKGTVVAHRQAGPVGQALPGAGAGEINEILGKDDVAIRIAEIGQRIEKGDVTLGIGEIGVQLSGWPQGVAGIRPSPGDNDGLVAGPLSWESAS